MELAWEVRGTHVHEGSPVCALLEEEQTLSSRLKYLRLHRSQSLARTQNGLGPLLDSTGI